MASFNSRIITISSVAVTAVMLAVGPASAAVYTSDVSITMDFQFQQAIFNTGPNAGTAAEEGVDFDIDTYLDNFTVPGTFESGTGSINSSSSLQVNGSPFDPFNDDYFSSDLITVGVNVFASASADNSEFTSILTDNTSVYADIYSDEGLTFIFDYSFTSTMLLDNPGTPGDGGLAVGAIEGNAFYDGDQVGDIPDYIDRPFGIGDFPDGVPTNFPDSDSGQVSFVIGPPDGGYAYIQMTFETKADAFVRTPTSIPEPSMLGLLLGGTLLTLRRRRR